MKSTAILRRKSAAVGRFGENAACRHLEANGLIILGRNWKTKAGELDIIALDGTTLVFVEVKTLYRKPGRTRPPEFRPLDNLTLHQRRRIARGALYYMRMLGHPRIRYRIDVVEVEYGPFGPVTIRHHRNAFGFDKVFLRK